MARTLRLVALALLLSAGVLSPMRPAHATGIPVIDVAALANLIEQISYWQKQIQAMTAQVNQLRATYNAITGTRGMQDLLPLSYEARNYLPAEYGAMLDVLNNASATYSGLAAQVQAILAANQVLTRSRVGALSADAQRIVNEGRQAAAMLQLITQHAQQNTSERFRALQALIAAIGAAGDDKAIQDLQGRIAAEQTMLTVEQTKLQSLYQMAQAQQMQREQRITESAVNAFGSPSSARSVRFP